MLFQKPHPISQLWLNRIFIGIIVLLALIAGYFYTETQRLATTCWQQQDAKALMGTLFKEKK